MNWQAELRTDEPWQVIEPWFNRRTPGALPIQPCSFAGRAFQRLGPALAVRTCVLPLVRRPWSSRGSRARNTGTLMPRGAPY